MPEIISNMATSTDAELSFVFPNITKDVYIGCRYRLSFQSETTMDSFETVLVDAGTREAIEPLASGLASKSNIEPNLQGLDWNVGDAVWPGKYYISVSNRNDVDLKSTVFTIRKMPKGVSDDEKERICSESDGSFYLH